MTNPFEVIEARLSNIENLLLDIKHPTKAPEPLPDRITLQDACELTGQSKGQLYKMTMLGTIPFSHFGKRLIFSRKALTEWMESRTISAHSAGDGMSDRLSATAKRRLKR
jgi:excisionase family DNA binding protein